MSKEDLNEQGSTPKVVDIDSLEVSLFVLCKDEDKFESTKKFLDRRNWPTRIFTSINELISILSKEKPEYVLISVDYPSPKTPHLPKLLIQTFNVEVIAFIEEHSGKSISKLKSSTATHKINNRLSGPLLFRRIKSLLSKRYAPKTENKDAKRSTLNYSKNKDKSDFINIKSSTNSSDAVHIQSSKSNASEHQNLGNYEESKSENTQVGNYGNTGSSENISTQSYKESGAEQLGIESNLSENSSAESSIGSKASQNSLGVASEGNEEPLQEMEGSSLTGQNTESSSSVNTKHQTQSELKAQNQQTDMQKTAIAVSQNSDVKSAQADSEGQKVLAKKPNDRNLQKNLEDNKLQNNELSQKEDLSNSTKKNQSNLTEISSTQMDSGQGNPNDVNREEDQQQEDMISLALKKALSETVAGEDLLVYFSDKVDHIYATPMTFETTRDSYLIVVHIADDEVDKELFCSQLKKNFINLLKAHKINIKVEKTNIFRLEDFDLKKWNRNKNLSNHIAQHAKGEVVVSALKMNSTFVSVNVDIEKLKTPFPTEDIPVDTEMDFNVYLYLNDNRKYFKYVSTGKKMSQKQKQKLLNKKQNLHVNHEDVERLNDHVLKTRVTKVFESSDEKKKAS